jgi:hypothetical protein
VEGSWYQVGVGYDRKQSGIIVPQRRGVKYDENGIADG